MKSTATRPEIRRYLAAVDRAATALPAGRRKELLADLSEHIDVALAERPGRNPERPTDFPRALPSTSSMRWRRSGPSRLAVKPLRPCQRVLRWQGLDAVRDTSVYRTST
ncbi:HAAS signaling domain-containing protein [Streptomyces aureus]|uniref:HAAS signaling domain-containing protein n=1 Tax=Streptomyces aureus TaxID=193461 RepID=UPI0036986327